VRVIAEAGEAKAFNHDRLAAAGQRGYFSNMPGTCSAGATIAATMVTGMLLMALAFWMYSIAVALVRVRCEIAETQ